MVYSKVVDVMSKEPKKREKIELMMIADWFHQKSQILKKVNNGMVFLSDLSSAAHTCRKTPWFQLIVD